MSELNRPTTVRLVTACVAGSLILGGVASGRHEAASITASGGLYAASPNHLWNRIHRAIHVRVAPGGAEYGFDTVDALLWDETRHLLTAPSHARAVALLDEFLASGGERLVTDPLKRGVTARSLGGFRLACIECLDGPGGAGRSRAAACPHHPACGAQPDEYRGPSGCPCEDPLGTSGASSRDCGRRSAGDAVGLS